MLKKLVAVSALLAAGLAQAFAPQAGTWVIDSENNGQPGRGFGLDVQNQTLVMQMYAYDANGNATFYLSAGGLKNNAYAGKLSTYRGGRYFGSGAISGVETGNAGNVSMRFVSGTQGFVTFPGEGEKAISRYVFGYAKNAESLKGIWLLTALTPAGAVSDFFQLTMSLGPSTQGTGLVANSALTFACEHMTSGANAGYVLCAKFDNNVNVLRTYRFTQSVNDGEGLMLPATGSSNYMLVVRRLATSTGDGTGVVVKDAPADDAPVDTERALKVYDALSALGAQALVEQE